MWYAVLDKLLFHYQISRPQLIHHLATTYISFQANLSSTIVE